MTKSKLLIPAVVGAVALLVFVPLLATAQSGSGGSGSGGSSGPGGGDRVRLRANLAATPADPLAGGHADFESRPDRIRLSVEVEDVASTGLAYAVIGDQFAGFLFIDANGFADLNLDSRDGDVVPGAAAGTPVFVVDFFTDTLLLAGTFAPH